MPLPSHSFKDLPHFSLSNEGLIPHNMESDSVQLPKTMNQTRLVERNQDGSHKHFSLAPSSRCLTDRRYVTRKQLFSTEPHASILKIPQAKMHPQEGKCRIYRRDSTDMTQPREDLTPQRFSLSHRDAYSSSSSTKYFSPSVADLRGSRSREEHTFSSPLFSSTSTEQSLSRSIPEFQPLHSPLRWPLTSTARNPTDTPHLGELKTKQKEGRGLELGSTGVSLEQDVISPHKAKHWACAIPKDLPPSPDRHSAAWDPNKEYQALLDYTYPLSTNHVTFEWDSSEHKNQSLLQAELKDSGIELGNLCSPTNLSGLDFSVNSTMQTEERSPMDRSFTDLQGVSRPSDFSSFDGKLSLNDPVSLYLDSLDYSMEKGELSLSKSGSNNFHLQCCVRPSSISTAFTPCTRIHHQPMCVCTEEDKEFRSLPQQLNNLQKLSRQVRMMTAQLKQPLTGSLESLEPGTSSSSLSSAILPEKPEAGDKTGEENSQAASQGDYVALSGNRRWVEPVGGRSSPSGLGKVEALLDQLCDLTLHRNSQEEQEQSGSLLQHIQVFSSHLEHLIHYLYTVSEKTELLAQPAVDMAGLKCFVDEYEVEVTNHLSLTSCAMHSGQLLLSCINTMSPFLRDSLQLIERESEALQSYNTHEHFSSILSAMDNLVQPKPVQQSKDEESLGVQ